MENSRNKRRISAVFLLIGASWSAHLITLEPRQVFVTFLYRQTIHAGRATLVWKEIHDFSRVRFFLQIGQQHAMTVVLIPISKGSCARVGFLNRARPVCMHCVVLRFQLLSARLEKRFAMDSQISEQPTINIIKFIMQKPTIIVCRTFCASGTAWIDKFDSDFTRHFPVQNIVMS